MEETEININNVLLPEPTLRRLPWYLAYVDILRQKGVDKVSSTKISNALNVDASQIAKDLSFLNLKGKTRIGYDVDVLVRRITDMLGFSTMHQALIVGVGSLGAALLHDSGLGQYGLHIAAGFDTNPELIGKEICGVRIWHPDEIRNIQREVNASIGILTVSAENAQSAADNLVAAGIGAIWNFTPYRVKVRDGIVMSNTSIYAHLALIYNRLSAAQQV